MVRYYTKVIVTPKRSFFSFSIVVIMRNVMQLKGKQLAAFLGTAEICQLFLF